MEQFNFFNKIKRGLCLLALAMGLGTDADAITINGTVFNDVNRNFVINAGENFSGLPVPLYIHLAGPTRSVLASVAVPANGVYSISGGTANGQYLVFLSTQQYPDGFDVGSNGQNVNTAPIPGYVTVGERAPHNSATLGDLNPNGILLTQGTATGSSTLSNFNFGIACKRAGGDLESEICSNERSVMELSSVHSYQNPYGDTGGVWSHVSGSGIVLNATADSIRYTAAKTNSEFRYDIVGQNGCSSDFSIFTINVSPVPETSQTVSICAGDSVCIVNSSTGGRSLYLGERVCYTMAGTYTDTLLYAAESGCDSIVTTTVNVNAIDASCGATATITGRVFNDLNNNTVIDGATEHFVTLPATLYIYLVNSDNIVVGVVAVSADGTYSLPVYPNTTNTLMLSTQQYPLGTRVTSGTPINTLPPAGWATTGENGTNNTGPGDGTPDGSLSVSVGASDVSDQNFGLRESGSLPVNLLSFEVVKMRSVVQLNWSTANERNSKGFEVERSADGVKWYSIGQTDSKAEGGNSNGIIAYGHTDNAPLAGRNFYRLKLIDLDGRYDHSPVHILNMAANAIMIAPNPANENVILSGLNGDERVIVYDMAGREMFTAKATGTILGIGLGDLSAGVYSIRIIRNDGSISTHKLVKN